MLIACTEAVIMINRDIGNFAIRRLSLINTVQSELTWSISKGLDLYFIITKKYKKELIVTPYTLEVEYKRKFRVVNANKNIVPSRRYLRETER